MANVLPEDVNSTTLWRGALLATISHAFGVAHYPDLSNLHSWDVYSYSVQDNMGGCATVCFPHGCDDFPDFCAGALFDPESDRNRSESQLRSDPHSLFAEIPPKMKYLSEHSLMYFLDATSNPVRARITTTLWGDHQSLHSPDEWSRFLIHGGRLLQPHLLHPNDGLGFWCEEWGLSKAESEATHDLWQKKTGKPNSAIFLNENQRNLLRSSERGFEESGEILNSINIWLFPPEE